jgi:4-methylaminobutanoate oxidase (formaldehyde-forming)
VNLQQAAEVIVIGGGIIGCSTAYHLARDHKANVILLEQNKITSGSTWHAAGLVGQLRSSASITQVLKYSVDLYKSLEAETGLQTGWKMTGCLRLATNQDRWIEFKRLATTAQSFGMEMNLLSPAETKKLWPLLDESDLVGSTFLPTDGQASPSDITQALAKGARMHGAKIFEGVGVTGFEIVEGRVTAVHTTAGTVKCDRVVNCGGQWARQIGAMAGVSVPLQPVKHQYVITEKLDGLAKDAPTIRDPDRRTYFKEEVGGLVFGGYEPNPISWDVAEVPSTFEFQLFDDDYDHFEQHMTEALARVPALANTGIKQMINGPESFTPDGNFILGRAPELKNFYMGCGFNAFGIASGGGAGWVLADWVMKGEAPTDLWSVDIRRFSALHRDRSFTRDRTLEAYGKHYTIGFPHEEYQSGRPKLVSPLYERLQKAGACFGSKLGWERPNWFAPKGILAKDVYSMGRQNWFDAVGAEHKATREKAGLFDQSSFAKFELKGPDAFAALQYICANQIPKNDGRLVYTQLLNTRGGIECDLTIARLAVDHFYLVTGTGFRTHDYFWIKDHIPVGMDAKLTDITEQWGTLSLMGPQSRTMLQAVCIGDLSAFKFGDAKFVTIVGHKVLALRVTYVGELGFELHAPIAALPAIYDALIAHGAMNCGYRAIESLRLEKGYRAWSADITANDTPLEAGLGWAVKFRSSEDFIGRKALEAMRGGPLKKMMVGFTTDREDIVLVSRETILRNGKFVGYLTSGGFGYTIGKPIGYGYLRNVEGVTEDWARAGSYDLVVAQERVKARIHFAPMYDPANEKVKG